MDNDGPKVIFLAPICCEDDGRQWCEDDGNWECECEDAKHKAVKYIRDDIFAAHVVVEMDLKLACERLVNDSMYKDHPEASQMAIDALTKAGNLHHGL